MQGLQPAARKLNNLESCVIQADSLFSGSGKQSVTILRSNSDCAHVPFSLSAIAGANLTVIVTFMVS